MNMQRIKELLEILKKNKLKKIFWKKKDEEILIERDSIIEYKQEDSKEDESIKKKVIQSDDSNVKYITSPMVGTFYSKSAPTKKAFVSIGDYVEEDTVVAVIEAMKVMNEIKSNVKGCVKEILVKDGDVIEFGTKLFKVK